MTAASPRPSHSDIVEIAAQAIADTSPVQAALVAALRDYLEITGAYVRSGRSSPEMVAAFDAGVAAIRAAAIGA